MLRFIHEEAAWWHDPSLNLAPVGGSKTPPARAKRVYDGNVSRVVSDAVRYIAYEEGRDALIASFGGRGRPTQADAAQLNAAWGLVAKSPAESGRAVKKSA